MPFKLPLLFNPRRIAVLLWVILPVILATVYGKPCLAKMKIALICSGSVTDGGWNQEGRDAIERVGKKTSRPRFRGGTSVPGPGGERDAGFRHARLSTGHRAWI